MEFTTFGLPQIKSPGYLGVDSLGGKGAGLVWLAEEGVPVPPGFVIPTNVWAEYDKKPKSTMKLIAKALPAYLKQLEEHFGYMPLLSVRSGARVSCPGMMDTILNVGIETNNINLSTWYNLLGEKCFEDSFQRLIQMYGSVVKGIRKESLSGGWKQSLVSYKEHTGQTFPAAQEQLLGAIEAVFKSWDNDRANEYRKMHGYDRAWGTAVTVQAMVFGNLNDQSATGVLFTRNPMTGADKVTGEWLPNAQGEDIVAGIRTPLSLDQMADWNKNVAADLLLLVKQLEAVKRDMLDIEFTIQDGKLYLLQVRKGKRSATAAIKIAVDMAKEGLITPEVAVKRVSAKELDLAQTATLDPLWTKPAAFTGLPACGGVVTGKPVFTKEDAINCKEPCILVTHETTPDDITGMKVARGIITMVGGVTSHAAVVATGMNRPCIVGVGQNIESFKDIEVISMDGGSGRIWTEKVPTVGGKVNGDIHQFTQLVSQVLNVVPVLFEAPAYPMPEALLYLGDQVLNPQKAVFTVMQTLKKVKKLYLDLVPSDEEMRFMNIVTTYNYPARVLDLLALEMAEGSDAFKSLVVISNVDSPFQRLSPGTDLRSLVMSDSEIVMTGLDTKDPAIQRVLAWKQAQGVKAVSIGAYAAECKSMVSTVQALQIIQNGVGNGA